MAIDATLLDVSEYRAEGYRPLVDYGAWRVAVLNYIDELLPENLIRMQRHDQTDEVFVLLAGRCILFIGEGRGEAVGRIQAVDMQPFKLYNVKKKCWHTHTLNRDCMTVIVENCDTNDSNSPFAELSPAQRAEIVRLTGELWGI
jgi:hypothetical protein